MVFDFKLQLRNIGPHADTHYSGSFNSNETLIYSRNGLGKTFISRMFRLADHGYDDAQCSVDDLLKNGSSSGGFHFSIEDNARSIHKKLDIALSKGNAPNVADATGYRFHVFNSDYVNDHLGVTGYTPDGNIEGVIVGKGNIDLSTEKEQLEQIGADGKKLKEQIDTRITSVKTELSGLGIHAALAEYKNITPERIIEGAYGQPSGEYSQIVERLKKLDTISEETPDIDIPKMNLVLTLDDELSEMLLKSYDKALFEEEFLKHIRTHTAFVRQGLEVLKSNNDYCPFCKQRLGVDARTLIDQYNDYLDNTEAITIQKIKDIIGSCGLLERDYSQFLNRMTSTVFAFNDMKEGFADYSSMILPALPETRLLHDKLQIISKLLNQKIQDISKSIGEGPAAVSAVNAILAEVAASYQAIADAINGLNKAKNKVKDEKKVLHKRACIEKASLVQFELADVIRQRAQKLDEYRTLRDEIRRKEAGNKTPKRAAVAREFQALLTEFFDGKYDFDENSFALTFEAQSLQGKASKVLSDGEKSIIAFCFYLASASMLVEEQDDYKELFFIIDDPISSMDNHFTYHLAQIIRTLGDRIDKAANLPSDEKINLRYIVLTHSADFFNVLSRNRIAKNVLVMTSDGIVKQQAPHQILLYHDHLREVYQVARGNVTPTYTVGNSIRHILEMLWSTERPDLNSYEEYFMSVPELAANEYLYTLSQDLSHAYARSQPPVDESQIRRACDAVISLLEATRYKGQITYIVNELQA